MTNFVTRSLVKRAALIMPVLILSLFVPHAGVQAAFRIHEDAFSISNSPGYCFAMVAFSRWYYLTRHETPPLRRVIAGQAQQKIARELQEFYSQNLIKIQADYCNRNHSEPSESFRAFIIGLVSGEPRIVLLMNKGPHGAVLHAVLAYEWLPEQNVIKVYDPNYSKEERFIDLEKRRYTSLDITYNSICFPEVLNSHQGLVKRMEKLYTYHVSRRVQDRGLGPIALPILKRGQAGDVATD
ncbi:MAG: hypothetical protein WCG29_06160 [Desulfomonile sp.]|nr:hypothetical protein [Deltaproteobacteria bacterium]